MFIFMNTYLFVTGLILGSFYNVVGLRTPNNQSVIKPRSHCTKCKHTLTFIDLIPVFSYLFLSGKCRKCKDKISPIYPTMELLTGLLFLATSIQFGLSTELLMAILLISLLVIITVSDIHYQIIPNKILLFFLPLLILARTINPMEEWWEPILGGLIGFCLLWVIAIISNGGMGGGDIKLFGLIGIALGWKLTFLALFLSTISGVLFAAIGLLSGIINRKSTIPFGPSISIGTIITYFIGEPIIAWYMTFL